MFKSRKNQIIELYESSFKQLTKRDDFYISDSSGFLYFNDFEESLSDTAFQGNGSFNSIKEGINIIATFPKNTFKAKSSYEIKLWMFNGELDALNLDFKFWVDAYDEKKKIFKNLLTIHPETAEVIFGDWSLIEDEFYIEKSDYQIFIRTRGKKRSKAALHADNLLINSKNLDVFKKDDNSLFYNIHILEY